MTGIKLLSHRWWIPIGGPRLIY